MTQRPHAGPASPPSPWALAVAFNRLALQGFGGVLAVAQRELVERLGWMSRAQFLELLSISQVLPGPNIVNFALIYGDRLFGWRGALAAMAGLLVVPLAIVLALALVHARFSTFAPVAGALRGMGAVAAGLVIATALKLVPGLKGNGLGRPGCLAVALLTFVAMVVLRLPLVAVVLAVGGGAVAWAWSRRT